MNNPNQLYTRLSIPVVEQSRTEQEMTLVLSLPTKLHTHVCSIEH